MSKANELAELLGPIIEQIQDEWDVSGLELDTLYGEFAIEVTKRAIAKLSEWQPIESAPRDGTRILVFEDGDQYVACWEDQNDAPRTPAERHAYRPDFAWIVASTYCGEYSGDAFRTVEPSHWKQLGIGPHSP